MDVMDVVDVDDVVVVVVEVEVVSLIQTNCLCSALVTCVPLLHLPQTRSLISVPRFSTYSSSPQNECAVHSFEFVALLNSSRPQQSSHS